MDIVVVESDAGTNSAGGISHDVTVAEHCTFGVAGRSTREADGGKHVGLRRAYGSGALGAGGLNFIKRHDGEVGVRLFDGFVNGSHQDDILEGAADDRESDLELGRAAHNGSEPGVLDDVLHSVVTEGVVHANNVTKIQGRKRMSYKGTVAIDWLLAPCSASTQSAQF